MPAGSPCPSLLCGQVHELDGLRVVHASRYPAPILSMALSPDASMLAVGLSDGILSMRRAARPARAGMTLPVSDGAPAMLVVRPCTCRALRVCT